LHKDTLKVKKLNPNILQNYNLKNEIRVIRNTSREIKRIHSTYVNILKRKERQIKQINIYNTEYFKRIAFSFSVFILFLVGAPLGSLIRKGGFGIPMIMAILIFVVYHFLGVMARGMAENGKISPFLGGWLSTFILLPFGLFLLYKAVQDKGLFDFDGTIKAILNFFKKYAKNSVNKTT
jgi:lipopolysaccharide export system permease protein